MLKLAFTPFPILHTPRLTLRQVTETDSQQIFALRSDDAVNKYLDRPKAESIDDALRFIQIIKRNIENNESIFWGIVFKNQPILMGAICFWNIYAERRSTEIGYELLPTYQGKGIMQEVFQTVLKFGLETMQLEIIEAHTTADNEPSKKILEKNNFKLVGKLQEENTVAETLVYSLYNSNI